MTQKFTINNFKQELKELAQLQHDEKLFFKHPERYPNFIKDHEKALIKEYNDFNETTPQSILWRLKENLKDNLSYQARESQTHCNDRRRILSRLYGDYYALKHWKKLNMDNNESMVKYFFKDSFSKHEEENYPKVFSDKMRQLEQSSYIDNSIEGKKIYDELKKMYHEKLLNTSEFYNKRDQLKRINWFEYKRNELLNRIDKEA